MPFSTIQKFIDENHISPESLTADEKVFAEIFDAIQATTSHEDFVQVKERYKGQFPVYTRVYNEICGFPHGPDTTAFVKALSPMQPSCAGELSLYDGELYFDRINDDIKHQYTKNPEWALKMKQITIDDVKKIPYTPDVDTEQLKDFDAYMDKVSAVTEEFFDKADAKYHVGMQLRNKDARSIVGVMEYALQKGDRGLYGEVYSAIQELEDKFHGIKNWQEIKFPMPNMTPSRNPTFPLEFKDSYFFSSILVQAKSYQSFKNATGLTLVDVAKNPDYLHEDMIKNLVGINLERCYKEEANTPAHDAEVFDLLTNRNRMVDFYSLGINEPMAVADCGMFFVTHLDRNFGSEQTILKQDANEKASSRFVQQTVDSCVNLPIEKRLEALVKVADPIKNWQSVFGLSQAPSARGAQIYDNAKKLSQLAENCTAEKDDKRLMMAGIRSGLNAEYKKNTWFLQRWIGWGDAKQYKMAIHTVEDRQKALVASDAATKAEEKTPEPVLQHRKTLDLNLNKNPKEMTRDVTHVEAPTVKKEKDLDIEK